MGDRPRDRPAVADDGVGDLWGGIGHHVIARGQQAGPLGGLVAEKRADAQRPVTLLQIIQVLDLVDVDQVAGTREAQLEQRDQALPARQHFPLIPKLIEELEGLVDGFGRVVFEWCWQHRQPLLL